MFAWVLIPSNTQAKDPSPKPNFILIMADNLGYGDIEPFGSKLHRTPNLNRMAREGCKLTSLDTLARMNFTSHQDQEVNQGHRSILGKLTESDHLHTSPH